MKWIPFVIILTLVLVSTTALAWDDCPFGEVDDPYPGLCSRYVDTDGDGICDLSQSAPEDRDNTTSGTTNTTAAAKQDEDVGLLQGEYHLLPVTLVLVALYVTGHILSKRGVIKNHVHIRFWNVLLLLSFLVSALLGILLVIQVNFGFRFDAPYDIMFWHVEAGIAMTAISIFHIFWHRKYFIRMIKG